MLLLTGATGEIGAALLPRLLADGHAVRCLVRDPRRLGAQRVRVQIALGDLTDPPSFRNAMRGVETVVHLAASIRDEPSGSIEELNGIASWRMVQAAREEGVQRFVFFSALGASTHSRGRFFRAKALAEQAVNESGVSSLVFAPSLVYAPGGRWMRLLERLSLAGVTPISGAGAARFQPIWTEDVADCVVAGLRQQCDGAPAAENGAASRAATPQAATPPADTAAPSGGVRRYELAGPQTLTHEQIVRLALRSLGRREAVLRVPAPIASRALRALERLGSPAGLPTPDEAELMEVSMVSSRGGADARALGVEPKPLERVLGGA